MLIVVRYDLLWPQNPINNYVILERSPITFFFVILGDSGFITALLLSRVMASMVNTLAGTVEREMN